MKKIIIGLIILFLVEINCNAQQKECSTTLGDFYRAAKTIKVDSNEKLRFKTSTSFDFKTFLPIEGEINRENYFEVGYDNKNQIAEIIHYDSNWHTMKFIVRHFDKFKIMLMQYDIGEYGFLPVAFFISDKVRFMVNFAPMTGKNQFQFGMLSDNPYIGPLENISFIMPLNEKLYPKEYFVGHKGYVYTHTVINYVGTSRQIQNLRVNVFFSPMERKGHKIESSLCMDDLSFLMEKPDAFMTTQPLDYKSGYPLWIFGGSSSYK